MIFDEFPSVFGSQLGPQELGEDRMDILAVPSVARCGAKVTAGFLKFHHRIEPHAIETFPQSPMSPATDIPGSED